MLDSEQRRADYEQRKLRLMTEAKACVDAGHKLSLKKRSSNLFRNRQKSHYGVDVTDFNHVICVDLENLTIEAEGMTPFETLVDEALPFGCLPAVVPELKSITIGGGFTGVAIESSSFRYGLVHETIIEADILLSDGRVVTATRDNEYKDLFYGFPNTYGALGYALRLVMKVVKSKPYVRLQHLHYQDPTAYFAKLAEVCQKNRQDGEVAYVDGTIFSENDLHLTLGQFVDNAPYTSNYRFMKQYYRTIAKRDEDYLTAKDYIWRWDTDWFWCSKNFGMQNPVMRLLLGKWMLKSTSYWKVMHFARNSRVFAWLEKRFSKPAETVIQDIEVPVDQAVRFNHFFHQKIGIKPVWVCPVQTVDPDNRFDFYDLTPDKLYVNFGFWDTVPSDKDEGHYNRLVENEVAECQGHKSLYSDVYYTADEFWNIYNKSRYDCLKAQYDPKGGLKDWYSKVSVK